MTLILTAIFPLLLLATLVPSGFALLRHWTHPSRLTLEAFSAGFMLLVCGLVLPMSGWLALAWWAVLVLHLAGAGIATWRALTASAPHGPDLSARARAAAHPVGVRSLLGSGILWAVAALIALVGG
ncbi:hypothetical protein [Brachybacterium sp. FME24]|uniref:hypothetical protein n=1 Tax=Brachybacterium sp. FME24 TaxID=2742605 RepID=UPI00186698D6|nr:hypothetical protein [Brachybacterium sp. FME24]